MGRLKTGWAAKALQEFEKEIQQYPLWIQRLAHYEPKTKKQDEDRLSPLQEENEAG